MRAAAAVRGQGDGQGSLVRTRHRPREPEPDEVCTDRQAYRSGRARVMRKAGGNPLEYLKLTMSDVIVTRVKPSGSKNDVDKSLEKVSLSFREGQAGIRRAERAGR